LATCLVYKGNTFITSPYHDEVRTLRDGEALLGAMRATERGLMDRAQRVWLRPSTLWTGEETVRVV
jgi:hypothetical protein